MTTGPLLAHRVEGEGEPLLLLNGGLMTYAAWEPLASLLRVKHRLVLCDLRGQLLSPGQAPADLADNVDDVTALLDHLEIASTHVLGTSYGGEIGLLLAALAPERVRSVIGVTVSDYVTESMQRGAEDLRAILLEGTDAETRGRFHDRLVTDVYSASFKQRFAAELAARRSQLAALPDFWFENVEGLIAASETLDLRPHLASIRTPTLIVSAADDRVMPVERSRALAAGISSSESITHETSGHALVAEDPAWLAEVVLGFLARQASSDTTQPPPT